MAEDSLETLDRKRFAAARDSIANPYVGWVNILRCFFYASGTAAMVTVALFMWDLKTTAVGVTQVTESVNGVISQMQPKIGIALDRANRALLEADFAAKAARKSSEATVESVKKIPGVVGELQTTVKNVTTMAESVTDDIHALADHSIKVIDKVGPVMDNAAVTVKKIGDVADSTTAFFKNPDLEMTFKNVNSSTAHLNGMLQDGNDITTYYKKQLTKPAGFFKTILSTILPIVSNGRVAIQGPHK